MSKISDGIRVIHELDMKSNKDTYLGRMHPLVKLIVTIVFIVSLTSIHKYNLTGTFSMLIFLWIISIVGDLSITSGIRRFFPILLILCLIGVANPILDRTVVFYLGRVPITTGFISFITLILKGIFSVVASYFLILTTSIESICWALKILHFPNILITIFMLIYRYIILLLKEVDRIWISYSLRSPGQRGVHFKAWGSMIGSLLLRSLDRGRNVYESMELRGFNPDTFFVGDEKIKLIDVIIFISGIAIIMVLRFVPLLDIIGGIFI